MLHRIAWVDLISLQAGCSVGSFILMEAVERLRIYRLANDREETHFIYWIELDEAETIMSGQIAIQ